MNVIKTAKQLYIDDTIRSASNMTKIMWNLIRRELKQTKQKPYWTTNYCCRQHF